MYPAWFYFKSPIFCVEFKQYPYQDRINGHTQKNKSGNSSKNYNFYKLSTNQLDNFICFFHQIKVLLQKATAFEMGLRLTKTTISPKEPTEVCTSSTIRLPRLGLDNV